MDIRQLSDRLSPDLMRVTRRFPLAVLFALAATLVAINQANNIFYLPEEDGLRLFGGAVTGFILALAGVLFSESRPTQRIWGLVLAYLVPLASPLIFQIRDENWVVLPLLPVAALMWLSVSAFSRFGNVDERNDIQNRFWWLNQRVVISGTIAILAAIVFFVGVLAIDRSLDLLFGIEIWDLMVQWVLPIVYCLFVPVYWLAALPKLDDYDPEVLDKPDFLTQAIGFVGQFILTPLLAIYALILAAYAVQIAVTQTLPVGVLGWLVMAFVVTGAANWLVLYPGFVRARFLARFFRLTWFWATLVPLFLFALGLFVRVDAYGLTPERLLLIAGGVWALVLTFVYLLPGGRGDIRLMPALAGLAFLALSMGPFNVLSLPLIDQAQRFETALAAAQAEGRPGWTPVLAEKARGALEYLDRFEDGEARLKPIFERQGLDAKAASGSVAAISELIGLPEEPREEGDLAITRTRPPFKTVSVEGTPYFLGDVTAHTGASPPVQAGLVLGLAERMLRIGTDGSEDDALEVDLSDWLDRQAGQTDVTDPVIDFALGPRKFRLVVRVVQIEPVAPGGPQKIDYLAGWLFSDRIE